jgi:hypothetical protein
MVSQNFQKPARAHCYVYNNAYMPFNHMKVALIKTSLCMDDVIIISRPMIKNSVTDTVNAYISSPLFSLLISMIYYITKRK